MLKTFIEIVEIQLFYTFVVVLVGGYLVSPFVS
ncbi:MAG: hypothetical protein ACI9RG_000190 [Sulfurimonas sp.]|jgi:hypothetical protein